MELRKILEDHFPAVYFLLTNQRPCDTERIDYEHRIDRALQSIQAYYEGLLPRDISNRAVNDNPSLYEKQWGWNEAIAQMRERIRNG